MSDNFPTTTVSSRLIKRGRGANNEHYIKAAFISEVTLRMAEHCCLVWRLAASWQRRRQHGGIAEFPLLLPGANKETFTEPPTLNNKARG